MVIMKKPVTAEKIMEWILRNTKVSELEEMTLTIIGYKIEELSEALRRERG